MVKLPKPIDLTNTAPPTADSSGTPSGHQTVDNAAPLGWWSPDDNTQPNTQPASPFPVRDRYVRCHIDETTNRLVIDYIPDGYTEEEKELIAHWYPETYGQPSPHARTSHGIIITGEDALAHAYATLKEQDKRTRMQRRAQRAERSEQQEEYAKQHMAWIAACGERKKAIEVARTELRARTEQRRTAIASYTAQWDAYVGAARETHDAAKAVPVPPRPVKPEG